MVDVDVCAYPRRVVVARSAPGLTSTSWWEGVLEFFTPADLAKMLSLKSATITHHIRKGHIRVVKPSRDYFIPADEVERIVAQYSRNKSWEPVGDVPEGEVTGD